MIKVKNAVADWFEWLERHGELVLAENRDFEVEASEMRALVLPTKAP